MMDAANYAKAVKNANDTSIQETQLTTDGVEDFGYGGRGGAGGEQQDQQQQQQNENQQGQEGQGQDNTRAAPDGGQHRVVARFEEVRAGAPRFAQDPQALGDQRAGQSAADAGNLQLRDAGRGQHAAIATGDFRRGVQGQSAGQGGRIQGPDDADRGGPSRGAAARAREDRTAVGCTRQRQALLHPPEPRHEAPGCLRGRYHDRRGEAADPGADERLHREQAAQGDQQRHGTGVLERARRVGPLLPVRRGRHVEEPDHAGRVRGGRYFVHRREEPRNVSDRQRPRGWRRSILHALLPRQAGWQRHADAGSRRCFARGQHERLRPLLHRHLLQGEHRAEECAVRRRGRKRDAARNGGPERGDAGRVSDSPNRSR